jgi:hypothetical protein
MPEASPSDSSETNYTYTAGRLTTSDGKVVSAAQARAIGIATRRSVP